MEVQTRGDSIFGEKSHLILRHINHGQMYISEHLSLHILLLSAYGKHKRCLFSFSRVNSFGFGVYTEW